MPLLADDFFRLCHHDMTGRPLLHPVAMSTGLAGALLAELVWAGLLDVKAGVVVAYQGEPEEALSRAVLSLLRREDHPLPTWLVFLSQRSVNKVAHRMLAAGHIRVDRSRRRLRSSVTYMPTNSLEAARPISVLSTSLHGRSRVEPDYGCLAGLMAATGLHTRVLAGAPASSYRYLQDVISQADLPMQEIFAATEYLVAAAVLTHRA